MTTLRVLATGLVALLAYAAPAAAFSFEEGLTGTSLTAAQEVPDPHPLTGEGENFEIVGNLPIDPGSKGVAASDIEMHGDYAFIGSYGEGMVIADISDPVHPKRAGTFTCGGGSQYDVQLSNDGNLAVLSTDGTGASCLKPGQSGSMVIDVTDKTKPVMVAFIPIAVGTHTQTLDDRILYINNYPTSYSKLEVYDLSSPVAPAKLSELSFNGEDSVHDSFVDHRPDGRDLLYAASIGYTDVIEVTDPSKPKLLQRIADPRVTISHQAEPSHDRKTLVVTDEFNGGGDAPGCGQAPVVAGEGLLPLVGDPTNIGALYFYGLDADGTITNNGEEEGRLGSFNLPYQQNPSGGCTVHVFWQAPDESRLVTAWYGRGIRVVDFSDPADATEIGWYIPTDADAWSAKPHRGYIFTGDIARGMDVLRYTGEDGKRWPATAGPQEDQRHAYRLRPGATAPAEAAPQEVPAAEPPAPQGGVAGEKTASPTRVIGGAKKRLALRVPGRGLKTLTATFTNRRGGIVTKLRFRVRAGKTRRVNLTLAGVPGRYRYTVRVGDRGRVLRKGVVLVSSRSATGLRVAAGRTLVCRIG